MENLENSWPVYSVRENTWKIREMQYKCKMSLKILFRPGTLFKLPNLHNTV